MKYEDKCIYIDGKYVPIGFSVSHVMLMVKEKIIPSATSLNELKVRNLNRYECYYLLTIGLRHHDPEITVQDVSLLCGQVPLSKMQRAIKAAIDILKEDPRKTELR